MSDYDGPVPDPTKRWMVLADQPPCPTCGELLIAHYTTQTTLGGKVYTRHSPGQCRNGCETSAV